MLRSAPKPRVEVAPDNIAGTFGPEALDLARRAGIEADSWQGDAVNLLLSFRADMQWACRSYCEWVARQNGKGVILEIRALAGLFLLGEELIMWSAHEVKTAQEAFRRMRARLATMGREYERRGAEYIEVNIGPDESGVDQLLTVKIVQTNGREGFEILETGQRLIFIARSKGSGRGFSGDLNIVDESFAYTFVQQEALGPTMRARPNPQTIYTSTPPLDGASGEVMYKLRSRAESKKPGRLGYRDWGLGGDLSNLDKLDLDDKANWSATNPAYGIRVTAEAMQEDRDDMSAEGFAREIFCVWPRQVSAAGGSIDAQAWQRLFDTASKRDSDIAIAVDIAPERTWAALSIYGPRADGLGHVELVDYRAGTAWLLPRLVAAMTALDPVAVGMGRGTYASLKESLSAAGIVLPEDSDKPHRGALFVASGVDMAAACAQLIDAVRDGTLRHVGDKQLTAAVLGAKTKANSDSIGWSRTESGVDVSPLVAATLARFAYLTRVDLVDQEEERGPILW